MIVVFVIKWVTMASACCSESVTAGSEGTGFGASTLFVLWLLWVAQARNLGSQRLVLRVDVYSSTWR
ncbi:hypothetical protein BKG75_16200 [Mycobacteroides chelonae]|nr:hypothetical protein DYE20_04580 [[Mycobacterium] chelonae subsp. gwanakae]OHU16498.1 hypothetical protein BKG75_16200 [Mycobacteroides chelonae]